MLAFASQRFIHHIPELKGIGCFCAVLIRCEDLAMFGDPYQFPDFPDSISSGSGPAGFGTTGFDFFGGTGFSAFWAFPVPLELRDPCSRRISPAISLLHCHDKRHPALPADLYWRQFRKRGVSSPDRSSAWHHTADRCPDSKHGLRHTPLPHRQSRSYRRIPARQSAALPLLPE